MSKPIKILVLVGGSGGHVTPAIAVLRELKKRSSDIEIRAWCDATYAPQVRSLMHTFDTTVLVQTVLAGKLRRYHHLKWWQYFTSPTVTLPNIRDTFRIIGGFFQSIMKFIIWRPDVVFAKGGFVSVPAGIASRLFNIPLVIHDSDSHPGLANRILARFATVIATGAPVDNYPYNKKRTHYTGIPTSEDFHPYTEKMRRNMKSAHGFKADNPLVVITGGGLGAGSLNYMITSQLESLLKLSSILLLSGTDHYDEIRALTPDNNAHFQLYPFINGKEMAEVLGAADLVISRAGATTILELSALAKPTILIPNAKLTAGHQLKNAAEYAKDGAVAVIEEHELAHRPSVLLDMIKSLLSRPEKRQQMAKIFHAHAKPNAAKDVATLIEEVLERRNHR